MVSREYTCVDPEKDAMQILRAENQREAVVKALERGIRPSRSTDVRPRTGDETLMSRDEFEGFLDEVLR